MLGTEQDVPGADDLQGVGLGPVFLRVAAIDDDHGGAQFDQRVRGGKPRQSDAGDHHAQSGPVRVPGCQRIKTVHEPSTHSA